MPYRILTNTEVQTEGERITGSPGDERNLVERLNQLEADGWTLKFIRPSWSMKVGVTYASADETFVFHSKPKAKGGEVWGV